MSDPFAMFAEDVKSAVPSSPGEVKKESAFDAFAASQSTQPTQPALTNVPPQTMESGGIGSPIGQMPPMNQSMLVPMNSPSHPYSQPPQPSSPGIEAANPFQAPAAANPFGAPASPTAADPFGAPTSPVANPFGAQPAAVPPAVVSPGAMVHVPEPGAPPPNAVPPPSAPPVLPPAPAAQAPMPNALPPSSAPPFLPPEPAADPWAVPPPQQPAFPAAADPFGAPQAPPQQDPAGGADPFSVFSAAPPAAAPPAAAPAADTSAIPSADDDMWAQMGFDPPSAPAAAAPSAASSGADVGKEMPEDGEYYDVKIFTQTLGIVFFRPGQLTDSLFLETDRAIVDSLGTRPVVSHILEGSSARSAKVELGHVLLKVNDTEVYTPEEAVLAIREGPRPLPLLFYVPNTNVTVAEGEHMVKYDSIDYSAPLGAQYWKSKYVVIGGIISKPWLVNMYRNKEEYDVAVIEAQSSRKVSVKVKQFTLAGARIEKDGPVDDRVDPAIQSVKYAKKMYPWRYFVITPAKGMPIKISATSPDLLKPVLDGVRRVLHSGGGARAQAALRAAQRSPPRPSSPRQNYPSSPLGADTQMTPYTYDGSYPSVQKVESY